MHDKVVKLVGDVDNVIIDVEQFLREEG